MVQVLTRRHPIGYGLEKSLEAVRTPGNPVPIPLPPSNPQEVSACGASFTFESFTIEDALELGNLLYARLLPHATAYQTPCIISISLANSNQVVFQVGVGSGTLPDQEDWIRRKRNSVLRWGTSTWMLRCKLNGDPAQTATFLEKHTDQPGNYALHGGAVPIRVKGAEGLVAIVTVSGLKQQEDHGAIVDVIRENWQ